MERGQRNSCRVATLQVQLQRLVVLVRALFHTEDMRTEARELLLRLVCRHLSLQCLLGRVLGAR